MPKIQTRHARRMKELRNTGVLSTDEGKWETKFVFDGKVYRKTHKLSPSEVKHMKDLCEQFGDEAAGQIIWRAAIKGIGVVAENTLAEAGRDYMRAHYKGPQGPASDGMKAVTYADVISPEETQAVCADFLESRKPLPETEAFSEKAKEQIIADMDREIL